jgi:hypothetical protein
MDRLLPLLEWQASRSTASSSSTASTSTASTTASSFDVTFILDASFCESLKWNSNATNNNNNNFCNFYDLDTFFEDAGCNYQATKLVFLLSSLTMQPDIYPHRIRTIMEATGATEVQVLTTVSPEAAANLFEMHDEAGVYSDLAEMISSEKGRHCKILQIPAHSLSLTRGGGKERGGNENDKESNKTEFEVSLFVCICTKLLMIARLQSK